jgi:hypothetical protein
MLRGLVLFASVTALSVSLGAGSLTLGAGNITCSLTVNNAAVPLPGCYQQTPLASDFFYNQTLDWNAALGPATQGVHSGPWATSNQGINVTLTSPGLLQSSDNTEFAWDGAEWTLPDLVPGFSTISTFAGHFAAPNIGSLTSPFATPDVGLLGGRFGDDLAGVLGGAPLTITFSTPVLSAGFLVSARTLANFTATLQAYDSQNVLIGTYAIVASGLGGVCTGLTVFNNGVPQPCTGNNAYFAPAPFIGFVAPPNDQIARLVLQTSDNSGLFIDQMYFDAVPEPATLLTLSGGLGLLAWLRRRRAKTLGR